MTKPTMKACGSCHDGTSFLATAPAAVSHNKGNDQADDSACATCHTAQGTKKSVLETHMPVADPDPTATWLGGTNASTNAAYLPAAGVPTPGATRIAYDVKSITRDLNKNPSIVFRFTKYTITPKDGIPIVFNTYIPGVTTELMDGFANSPSVYFAFAVPQDGLAAPADFNATASGYIKGIWNGSATGAGAGTMIFDPATGYYTITLIGVTIPDTATMLTGGVGYTYSLSTTPPMVQTDLPAYPYGDSTTIPNCIAGKMCGGLIVTAQDVAVVATDTATGKAYSARRPIVDTANCLKCHEQLGANPTFHAGQRNDGATCAFCHKPNQTSGGWSASSSTFIHGIHGASIRNTGFSWHAACPTGTTFADGTCTAANADPYFANVSYPGVLNNCLQCHKPGTFDFSATTSAAALPNLLMSTVGTGTYAADISTSRYVTLGQDYGTNFSTANLTSGTKDGVACTTAAPCPCTLTSPCNASGTTLVESPITAACSACHDAPIAINHMKEMGGTFYGTRTEALARTESCMLCHGPGTIAAIAAVHK
jgi:OmcA/MtrC family decaheme c-type cytochrome